MMKTTKTELKYLVDMSEKMCFNDKMSSLLLHDIDYSEPLKISKTILNLI